MCHSDEKINIKAIAVADVGYIKAFENDFWKTYLLHANAAIVAYNKD